MICKKFVYFVGRCVPLKRNYPVLVIVSPGWLYRLKIGINWKPGYKMYRSVIFTFIKNSFNCFPPYRFNDRKIFYMSFSIC
ncbi:hypothetical protein O3M35_003627 [Rhynocoris fuscipes]|uniref:Uncharacterized protein n=1 Tax=Rhynocoris fuscipes TaxID=488301 RepID=A0AAW1CRE0_9HEMI